MRLRCSIVLTFSCFFPWKYVAIESTFLLILGASTYLSVLSQVGIFETHAQRLRKEFVKLLQRPTVFAVDRSFLFLQ